jgi:hypothetical protein
MINLSKYNFSTRHRIYRDICLLFLGEPTVVPFSRALLSRTLHEAQNFRQHNPNSKLTSVVASLSFLAAVVFCVIVWQKTTLPAPDTTQAAIISIPTASQSATHSASRSATRSAIFAN